MRNLSYPIQIALCTIITIIMRSFNSHTIKRDSSATPLFELFNVSICVKMLYKNYTVDGLRTKWVVISWKPLLSLPFMEPHSRNWMFVIELSILQKYVIIVISSPYLPHIEQCFVRCMNISRSLVDSNLTNYVELHVG